MQTGHVTDQGLTPRKYPLGQLWLWFKKSWTVLRTSPWIWLSISTALIFVLIMGTTSGPVGYLILPLVFPFLVSGALYSGQQAVNGDGPDVAHVFLAGRSVWQDLLKLGLLTILGAYLCFALYFFAQQLLLPGVANTLATLTAVPKEKIAQNMPRILQLQMQLMPLKFSYVCGMILVACLSMCAAGLVLLRQQKAWEATKLAIIGVGSNFWSLLLLIIALLLTFAATIAIIWVAIALLHAGDQSTVGGWMVMGLVITGSIFLLFVFAYWLVICYHAFADIFPAPKEDEAPTK